MNIRHVSLFASIGLLFSLETVAAEPKPEFYGVYALDNGQLTEITGQFDWNEMPTFSGGVTFIIHSKDIENLSGSTEIVPFRYLRNMISVGDGSTWLEHESETVSINEWKLKDGWRMNGRVGPVVGEEEMVSLVPDNDLAEGIYAISSGGRDLGYFFVGWDSPPSNPATASACVDVMVSNFFDYDITGNGEYVPCSSEGKAQAAFWDLATASKNGDESKVMALLQEGADVNATGENGYTALWAAAKAGHTSIVSLLVAHGADMGIAHQGFTPLLTAVNERHKEVVWSLLLNGADPDVSLEKGGWTPLIYAAHYGDVEIVDLLLRGGADVMIQSDDGYTAIDVANSEDNTAIAEMLTARAEAPHEELEPLSGDGTQSAQSGEEGRSLGEIFGSAFKRALKDVTSQ